VTLRKALRFGKPIFAHGPGIQRRVPGFNFRRAGGVRNTALHCANASSNLAWFSAISSKEAGPQNRSSRQAPEQAKSRSIAASLRTFTWQLCAHGFAYCLSRSVSRRGHGDIRPFLDAPSGFAKCNRDHDNADAKQRDGEQEKEDTLCEIECVRDNHRELSSNDIFGGRVFLKYSAKDQDCRCSGALSARSAEHDDVSATRSCTRST
jgi:hypothetical protein